MPLLHFAIDLQPSYAAASPTDCFSCSLPKRIRKFDGYLEDKMTRLNGYIYYYILYLREKENKKTSTKECPDLKLVNPAISEVGVSGEEVMWVVDLWRL